MTMSRFNVIHRWPLSTKTRWYMRRARQLHLPELWQHPPERKWVALHRVSDVICLLMQINESSKNLTPRMSFGGDLSTNQCRNQFGKLIENAPLITSTSCPESTFSMVMQDGTNVTELKSVLFAVEHITVFS